MSNANAMVVRSGKGQNFAPTGTRAPIVAPGSKFDQLFRSIRRMPQYQFPGILPAAAKPVIPGAPPVPETKVAGVSDAQKLAFVDAFMDKCAELKLNESRVAQLVHGICSQDSPARDAFELFIKKAVDLASIPQSSAPAPVPNRNDPPPPVAEAPKQSVTEDKARTRERMMKRYASAEQPGWNMADFLKTPIKL